MPALKEFANEVDLCIEGEQVVYVRVRTYFHIFISDLDVEVAAETVELRVEV